MDPIATSTLNTMLLNLLGLFLFYIGGHICLRTLYGILTQSPDVDSQKLDTYKRYVNWAYHGFVFIWVIGIILVC